MAIVVQVLALIAWWEARESPVAVLWSCPYCGEGIASRFKFTSRESIARMRKEW
jgi:hypothetical protein